MWERMRSVDNSIGCIGDSLEGSSLQVMEESDGCDEASVPIDEKVVVEGGGCWAK